MKTLFKVLYLLTSERIRQFLDSRTESVTKSHKRVDPHLIPRIIAPIPSLEEQNQIVSFLESESSRINEILSTYQKLVDTLKEKRIALISHVVTKGLDLNVTTKDSGVEWVGKIPNHWTVKRLKYNVKINQKALSESTNPDYEMSYLDISSVSRIGEIISLEEMSFDKSPSRARRIPQNKDTIISTVRTYLKAITHLENIPDNLIVSTGFAVLNPNEFIFPKFLYYLTTSEPFVQMIVAESKGVAYPAINPTEIANLYMWYPEIDEQSKIVSYLDIETSKIDTLVHKINNQIDLLNEYKTSLISHVVTGKINICEVVENERHTRTVR